MSIQEKLDFMESFIAEKMDALADPNDNSFQQLEFMISDISSAIAALPEEERKQHTPVLKKMVSSLQNVTKTLEQKREEVIQKIEEHELRLKAHQSYNTSNDT